MIDINLIPTASRKKSASGLSEFSINIRQDIIFGVVGGLIALLLIVHLLLGTVWLMELGSLTLKKAQWQGMAGNKSMLDAIDSESTTLNKKIAVINGMTIDNTVVWSPKLNIISDVLPRGIWLRKLVLDKTSLSMDGSAVSKDHNEIANVGEFVASLKNDASFMKDFASLDVNSIQRGKRNGIEVADFNILAKLK